MATARPKKTDVELKRLKIALKENETLMQEAAINYENLAATQKDLTAAIHAREDLQPKKSGVN